MTELKQKAKRKGGRPKGSKNKNEEPKKEKNKGGRPTKYREDMPQRILDWLDTCNDEEFEFHKTRGDNSNSFDRKLRVKLPTIQGLSLHLDICIEVINKWDKDPSKPEFSNSLEKVRQVQHDKLIFGAISGDYNPTIAKLLLMSNHGHKEKSETESNVKISGFGLGHAELSGK